MDTFITIYAGERERIDGCVPSTYELILPSSSLLRNRLGYRAQGSRKSDIILSPVVNLESAEVFNQSKHNIQISFLATNWTTGSHLLRQTPLL